MHVVVTGASGLIGQALVAALQGRGHRVTRLVRRAAGSGEARWDPAAGELDPAPWRDAAGVVHLSGESLSGPRWTPAVKRRLRESRVGTTRLLAERLAGLDPRPRVLVCASAVGIYGDRGDQVLTERSTPGIGFLPELVRDWEAAAEPARASGIRVVHARTGVVLALQGGALGRLIPMFRWGLGGSLGSGRQWWPWIAIDDMVEALLRSLEQPVLEGPVNLVAPGAVRQREFASALGRALGRPAVLPAPAFALRVVLGEMADMLLDSARVVPERLVSSGYTFRHPDLPGALAALLRPRRG